LKNKPPGFHYLIHRVFGKTGEHILVCCPGQLRPGFFSHYLSCQQNSYLPVSGGDMVCCELAGNRTDQPTSSGHPIETRPLALGHFCRCDFAGDFPAMLAAFHGLTALGVAEEAVFVNPLKIYERPIT
jgi:hypothetical protein